MSSRAARPLYSSELGSGNLPINTTESWAFCTTQSLRQEADTLHESTYQYARPRDCDSYYQPPGLGDSKPPPVINNKAAESRKKREICEIDISVIATSATGVDQTDWDRCRRLHPHFSPETSQLALCQRWFVLLGCCSWQIRLDLGKNMYRI